MKNANLSNYLSENHQFQSILSSDREQMVGEGTFCFSSELGIFLFLFCFKLWSIWVNQNRQEFRGTFSLLHHAVRTIMGETALSAFMQILGNAHRPFM